MRIIRALLLFLIASVATAANVTNLYVGQAVPFGTLISVVPSGGGGTDLTSGLIAYWSLDEADGTVDTSVTRIDSIGGNNLTDGTGAIGTYATNGAINNAAYFRSGATPKLSIADNAALSGADADRSYSALVYLDSLPASSQGRTFISRFTIAGDQREYALFCGNTAGTIQFSFIVSSNGTLTTAVSDTTVVPPSTATWYRLFAYHSATDNQIGISVNNGTTATATHNNGMFDGTGSFMLGSLNDTGNYFQHGRIDEVRIWNRILTTDERSELDDLLTP